MKLLVSALFFIILYIPCFSQVTLKLEDLPQLGDSFSLGRAFKVEKQRIVKTGQDIYDFTHDFQFIVDTFQWNFIKPSDAPEFDKFPNADMAMDATSDSAYLFLKKKSDGLYIDGYFSYRELYSGVGVCRPDELLYPAGFTLGDTVTNKGIIRIEVTDPFPGLARRHVTRTFIGEEITQLITLEGYYPNVIRVKTLFHETDTFFVKLGPILIPARTQGNWYTKYEYLREGDNSLLLSTIGDSSGTRIWQIYYMLNANRRIDPGAVFEGDTNKVYCTGDTLTCQLTGIDSLPEADSLAVVFISERLPTNFTSVSRDLVVYDKNKLKIVLPEDLIPGNNYRIRIMSGNHGFTSYDIRLPMELSSPPRIILFPSGGVCLDSSVLLRAFPVDIEYKWLPAGIPADTTNNKITIDLDGDTTVYAIGKNYCGYDTAILKLTPRPIPIISVPDDLQICSGDSVLLTANLVQDSTLTFRWENKGSIVAINTFPYVKPDYTDEYKIIAWNGCGAEEMINIEIFTLPPPVISGPNKVVPGRDTSFLAFPSDTGYDYHWEVSDLAYITGGQGTNKIKAVWTTPFGYMDTVRVHLEDTNGCHSTEGIFVVDVLTGLGNPENPEILVYPNPAMNKISIDPGNNIFNTISATLIDGRGREIQRYLLDGNSTGIIDIQSLRAGTYILLIRGDGEILGRKKIKIVK